MVWTYKYDLLHSPTTRLADAICKYPPDWAEMEVAVKDGANVNWFDENDDGETLLSQLFGYYWDSDERKDGRYLPQITKFFLEHGYDVNLNNHGNGGMALFNLRNSSYDDGMIESARLLLESGADLTYEPYKDGYDVLWHTYNWWDMYNENAPWGEGDSVRSEALRKLISEYEDFKLKSAYQIEAGSFMLLFLPQVYAETDNGYHPDAGVTVKIQSEGYIGNTFLRVNRDQIVYFADKLKNLYEKLNGTVRLEEEDTYPNYIEFSAITGGHIVVEGHLKHFGGYCNEQELTFKHMIDQTDIAGFVKRLYADFMIERRKG